MPGFGSCPRVKVMDTFDVAQFAGTWYYTASYPDKMMLNSRCAVTTFTLAITAIDSNGSILINDYNLFRKFVTLGKEKKYLGSAKLITSGVLGVNYPASPKANLYYNILDTDYYNYAVIFSCDNYYGVVNGQNLWVLARRKFLEPQYVQKTLEVITRNGLSIALLKNIDQGCDNPYPYAKV
ncbi:hypothetical protein PVAND_005051 [Polypedilum vanderplanki]|uniref:Lipocalin/cytosolic fatty-acid binding domain-containing protein n=1 Tax=Polypedilum vanderplanki TaxID=319348 RepID=A0A9J6BZE7_POLVA|nr:hypothetical protein PVAND_005051 [Polypedilum vanderplanki]